MDNPFEHRKLEWYDDKGRKNTLLCHTSNLDFYIEKLKTQGINEHKVFKLKWEEVK